ncbi:MAG: hypothetical protein LBP54_07675 [Campylobacteraceae bacterium]|nr:hypothetical protein [Campylobacteraceae bacterium]
MFCIKGAGLAWEFFWIAAPQAARNDGGQIFFLDCDTHCNNEGEANFAKQNVSLKRLLRFSQ